MKAIILAAGQGKRLLPHTKDRPKCLVPVAGRPVLEWEILVLLSRGLKEIVIMTGYRADLVESFLNQRFAGYPIRTHYNPDYATTDNLYTCWLAGAEMTEDFLLMNGDVLIEPEILTRLLKEARAPITLTINRKDTYDEDDMKVITSGKKLLRVGKDLPLSEVNGESIGLLTFLGEGPAIFRETVARITAARDPSKRWFLSAIDDIAQKGLVWICDITGLYWCEIDYPQDLVLAEKVALKIKEDLGLT